ncbi:MAG: aminoacyl-tRNA hydrolase [Spirochaetales bacterium]|nr:aminoacyl-tRNA hydrolase [Spirochaetales bacterium]
MSIRLIAGLGNPGPEYLYHRHNAGFMVLDWFKNRLDAHPAGKKWQSELSEADFRRSDGQKIRLILIKPQTFMNLSGKAIAPALAYYRLTVSDLLVIHDEIELPFGEVRRKAGGGHKGQNGLRSIMASCTADFERLRFGVGRPDHGDVAGHVLSNFSPEEKERLPSLLDRSVQLIEEWLQP